MTASAAWRFFATLTLTFLLGLPSGDAAARGAHADEGSTETEEDTPPSSSEDGPESDSEAEESSSRFASVRC